MKEIDICSMQREDAVILDIMLSACAEAAVKEARRKVPRKEQKEQGYADDVDSSITVEGLDVLYNCYLRSEFAYQNSKHKEYVRMRLESELNKIFPTNKADCYELLIPIMAYSLLINNEYNVETVRKRVQHDEEKDQLGDKKQERNVWGRIDPFKITRSTKPPKTKENIDLMRELSRAIKDTGEPDLPMNLGVLQTQLLLTEYETIKKLQDIGKIAKFASDILENSYSKDRPMNGLIRFYLINRLDGLLIKCSEFPDVLIAEGEEQMSANNLLLRYWENNDCDDECERDETLTLEIPMNLKSMGFDELYGKLIDEFTISEYSLRALHSYYFDHNRIKDMINLCDQVLDFAKAVIADIKSSSHTTNRTATGVLNWLVLCLAKGIENIDGDPDQGK